MEPLRVSVDEAKQRIESDPTVVFLDTRSQHAYDDSPVTMPDAVRVPPDAVEQRLNEIPRGRSVITFCT